MHEPESYAALFKRAASKPETLSDYDVDRLTTEDQRLLASHCEELARRVEALRRERLGLKIKSAPALTPGRLAEICAEVRRRCAVSWIPQDEWVLLHANPEQLHAVEAAFEAAIDEEGSPSA